MRTIALCMAALALAVAVPAAVAAAESAPQSVNLEHEIDFNIPSQALNTALVAFSRQSGIQVVTSSKEVEGRTSPAVRGRLSIREAASRLLEGSGLALKPTREGTVVVAKRETIGASDAATRLAQAGTRGSDSNEAGTDRPARSERIEVVGSHIRKPDAEGPAPVQVITREEIQRSGYGTVKEYIRTIQQSTATITQEGIFLTADSSGRASAFNLRGLGPESTLTLVNGRRIAGAATQRGDYTDISNIPLAAVERIEVLTDGASAIYGSDAVGGVVNVVLRKTFAGVDLGARGGNDRHGDSPEYMLDATAGRTWSTGNFIASLETFDRDGFLGSRRWFSSTANLIPRGGRDYRDTTGIGQPGTISVTGGNLPGLSSGFAAIPAGQDGTHLTASQLIPGVRNTSDTIAAYRSLLPDEKRRSGFGTLNQSLYGVADFVAEGYYAKSQLNPTFPPVSFTATVPATNPFTPFPQRSVTVSYIMIKEAGATRADVTRDTYSASSGFVRSFRSGWKMDAFATAGYDRVETRQPSIDQTALAAALADPNRATALNPFGDGSAQNPDTLRAVIGTFRTDQKTHAREYTAKADGPVGGLGGSEISAALGLQRREEDFFLLTQSAGRAAVTSALDRSVMAAFGELDLTLPGRRVEIDAAVRYERYSDFGSTSNPKIGVIWRLPIDVALRATWGTSFKAPLLSQLVPAAPTTLTTTDPLRNELVTVAFASGGNPDVKQQTAKIVTAGVVFEPTAAPGLSGELNGYWIDYTDRIQTASNVLDLFRTGQESLLPAGHVVRAPQTAADIAAGVPGRLTGLFATAYNGGVTKTSGADALIRYRLPTSVGTLRFSLNAVYVRTFKSQVAPGAQATEFVSTDTGPVKQRRRMTVEWERAAWGAEVAANYVGSYANTKPVTSDAAATVPAFTTFDAVLRYRLPKWWLADESSLQLSVFNVTDRDPPFFNLPSGYDVRYASARGRTYLLAARARF